MTRFTINESGMTFGPFERDDCFEVEACAAYKAIEQGVKVAEFAWLHPDKNTVQVWVVEAKSSSPQPTLPNRFPEFISEVHDKLVNGLAMVMAACLARPDSAVEELPASFVDLDLATLQPRFILVVRGHERSWLPPLQEALAKSLHLTVKIWGITAPAVVVMSDDMARTRKLIQ